MLAEMLMNCIKGKFSHIWDKAEYFHPYNYKYSYRQIKIRMHSHFGQTEQSTPWL